MFTSVLEHLLLEPSEPNSILKTYNKATTDTREFNVKFSKQVIREYGCHK